MPDYNVLLVTIDSLRRDFLGAYRDRPRVLDHEVATPNLDRFAERATVFETHYAGSLPCMPARREFVCGVREFPWRPWGPVEPFDDTVPALAAEAGATTGLITDHYHYFESGGRGYFEDYHGFEFVRGHETDAWRTTPRMPDRRLLAQSDRGRMDPDDPGPAGDPAYARNVGDFDELDEQDFFAPKVFSAASRWVRETDVDWDQWLCYVDSFDVHEPFHCPEPYASMYTDEDPTDPELLMWPAYASVEAQGMTRRDLAFVRSQFAGKVTMVDRWFGRLLDALDRVGAWEDTVVVVTTDHGYMLGEHGYVAKNYMPVYDPIANTPLLVFHPDGGPGRVGALTSAVDVYPTLLDAVGAPVPAGTHGESLLPLVRGERADHRDYALYGYFGGDVNVTDGRYTYFHPTDGERPHLYSSMHVADTDGDREAGQFLPYTDETVWRYPVDGREQSESPTLYDTRTDPEQATDLLDERPEVAERMRGALVTRLEDLDAPERLHRRLGV